VSISPFPQTNQPDIDPLELYASAIDTSDYVSRLVPQLRRLVPRVGRLLDVGAGGGQLGAGLQDRTFSWTAIEPSPGMLARLARLHTPPQIVAGRWEEAWVSPAAHDTVLAATMPAFFDHPQAFLARCRDWARRAIVWVVPAHAGPRGLIFAGCLPSEWHREDETPGIDLVLKALGGSRPHEIAFVEWTFSGVVTDLPRLARYLADRLGWPPSDERRPRLLAHLQAQAKPDAQGLRLDIPRKSAVLAWRLA
jgi:SAM-dependent methyltransferase